MLADKEKTFEERFEMLMASFQGIRDSQKESTERFDKAHEEAMKDFKKIREIQEKNAKQIEENNKNIGGVNRSLGYITEKLIYNTLEKSMVFADIEFEDIQPNLRRRSKSHNNLEAEYDIFLKNGEMLAIIETKQQVEKKHIIELYNKKLNNFRTLFPEYNNYKIILGMGGMDFDKEALDEANENGIGLIKVSGDNVEFHTNNIKQY